MKSARALAFFATITIPVLLTGCAEGIEKQRYQSRLIVEASPQEVFQAAQEILRREFGPVRADPESLRIETGPVEFQTRTTSGTARDLYGAPSTMRRRARFVAARAANGGAIARLRVEIERLDTQRQEAFYLDRQRRLSDAPGDTPIQRDAATTERQNTVWTFVKRDYRLERAILAELLERFAPASGPSATRAQQPPASATP